MAGKKKTTQVKKCVRVAGRLTHYFSHSACEGSRRKKMNNDVTAGEWIINKSDYFFPMNKLKMIDERNNLRRWIIFFQYKLFIKLIWYIVNKCLFPAPSFSNSNVELCNIKYVFVLFILFAISFVKKIIVILYIMFTL